MKISQLIELLSEVKAKSGDLFIWGCDGLDFPVPDKVELELTNVLKKQRYGFSGGTVGQGPVTAVVAITRRGSRVTGWSIEIEDR